MPNSASVLLRTYLVAIIVIGIAWIVDLPRFIGLSFIAAEWMGPLLGVGIAAAFLRHPYRHDAGAFELLLGITALSCWVWMSINYNDWIIDLSGATPQKYIPAALAIGLLIEALRKSAGLPITVLVCTLLLYGVFGYTLPGALQADRIPWERLAMYLYADTNGVPGLVMQVVGTLVLAFVVFGRLMDFSGAIQFFTDLALSFMGHKRGGPAKVAVVASSIFGSINGTAIGNVMSTGIVTIPLMKRSGFKAHAAGAIEAVASNGGQLAPPVMGATAFLIAEFLQVSYAAVVLAALVPALLYYVCLFLQVDSMAVRDGLQGIPKADLPRARATLAQGWVFLIPLAVLIYLLFGLGFDPAYAAIAAVVVLLVLSVIRNRRILTLRELLEIVEGAGESMLPLLTIAGGAGIVIGVMNSTGLGFSLSILLNEIGTNAGMLVMLALTALISIVLGMGMPTTAIYVVLSVVLAPALIQMGISAMAAHLFIFYFGLLSFLTPPVAIASFVAAGLAGSNMWTTSWEGMKLAAIAYLLPFLWCYNEALLLDGTGIEVAYAVTTALVAAFLIARGMQTPFFASVKTMVLILIAFAGAIGVGGATVWFGSASYANAIAVIAGVLFLFLTRRMVSHSLE
jgi:TRAP transporter 4TM/12TM fusion protein